MSEGFNLPAVLTELLYGNEDEEPLEETLDRLVSPNFVQRINGDVYKRSEYTAHVREMRQMVAGGGELRVLEQLSAATGIAGRYLFRMLPAEGPALTFESHLFARVEGGKIERMVEVARLVEDEGGEEFLAAA